MNKLLKEHKENDIIAELHDVAGGKNNRRLASFYKAVIDHTEEQLNIVHGEFYDKYLRLHNFFLLLNHVHDIHHPVFNFKKLPNFKRNDNYTVGYLKRFIDERRKADEELLEQMIKASKSDSETILELITPQFEEM